MKRKKILLISLTIFILFIIYTLMIKFIDVGAIGPNNSNVGFHTINGFVHDALGYNDFWYKVTKYLGILPFLFVAYYGFLGLSQLIKTKSIAKVDKKLLYLGCLYVLMGIVYIFFEKVIVNYRPVLLEADLEASYPSSHTILGVCICMSSLLINKYYINNKNILKIVNISSIILLILLVFGRLLSGVHWLTDIIGGIILSMSLIYLYYGLITKSKEE